MGSSVHLPRLRNGSSQHRFHRITGSLRLEKTNPFPTPLALNTLQGREGALWSSSPSQEGSSATRLIIDLKPCTTIETRMFPLSMRKLCLLPTAGEPSLPSEALWPYNHLGGSSEQELTTPWVFLFAGESSLSCWRSLAPRATRAQRGARQSCTVAVSNSAGN